LIDALARQFNFEEKLRAVLKTTSPGYAQSLRVAELLKNIPLEEVLIASRGLLFMPGAKEMLRILKERGYTIGVISDSYRQAIEAALEGLSVDFVEANELMENDGVLTGKIRMPLGWAKDKGCLNHSVCKLTALRKAANRTGVSMEETVAVGNGDIDICMIEAAGLGVAFNPISPGLIRAADIVIEKKDLREILKHV
jgi:phosphoserine phosphatase